MAESASPTPSAGEGAATPDPTRRRSARRMLLLMAAVCVAPVVASYAAYYFFPRDAQVNYGTLLPTGPAPTIAGQRADGTPFRLAELAGRWVMLANAGGACDAICRQVLYASRQARTIQGREQDRVVRVWLITDEVDPPAEVLVQHPGLVVARVPVGQLAALPGGPNAMVVIDPLGNLVLSYPENPDIKGIARDLTRLLKASRIG